ncbi:hypothetical protein CKO51_13085 [Rhodopirellula sp. SM50]|nr:hypothetical protein CKO51_13085 [Rhodopirellula sp. SM50]
MVQNKSDKLVLFLEGEELVGAKQNRVLNTSVLVAAHRKAKIPVSCVEQGRWSHRSTYFGSSGSHSPSKLRRALKGSVSKSLREAKGHASDQRQVWQEEAAFHASHGVHSKTAAMSDAFESFQQRIQSVQSKLGYIEGATGLAVAIGDQVLSLDLFDSPTTCEQVWDRLLTGAIVDSLKLDDLDAKATATNVDDVVRSSKDWEWEKREASGEGDEYRSVSDAGDHASVLFYDRVPVHISILAAT